MLRPMADLDSLGTELSLGDLLARLGREHGGYELRAHYQQGEFHHDVVVRVLEPGALPGTHLVVSTNCNGGVKEVLALDGEPSSDALWHHRCPSGEFAADALPMVRGCVRTLHWFDPCELLREDARSELRPEHRVRQRGGGWTPASPSGSCATSRS